MGVVQRQGFKGSLWMYLGVLLGFLNMTILYPRVLGVEVYGFVQWLFPTASVLAILSSMGVRSALIRYFPYFRDKEKGHNGILGLSFLVAHLGLLLVLLLIWLGKDFLIDLFRSPENAYYIDAGFWLLPILLVLLLYFDILTAYLTALLRPSITVFFKDILGRLLTTFLIICYYFEWVDIDQFLLLLVGKQLIVLLATVAYLWQMGELYFKIEWQSYSETKAKEMGEFSLYSLLTGVGNQLINRIDAMMLPALLSFTENGIYSVFYLITTVMIMPYEAVRQIATPLIANAWKENDLAQIEDIYQRTARGVFAVALLVYLGIIANLDNAVHLIGQDVSSGKMVAVWLGLGQLIFCVNGYNGTILNLSDRFRWDLLIKMLAVAVTIISNYVFIKLYGIIGAAVATASTIILVNLVYQSLIWHYFKIHPFTREMVGIVLIGIGSWFVQSLLPVIEWHFLADLTLRSALLTVVFITAAWFFRLVPELTAAVGSFFNRKY